MSTASSPFFVSISARLVRKTSVKPAGALILSTVAMDIPKESSRSYSHLPQGSLEVNHGHNGFSNLEVVPPIAPEAYGCPEPDQKVSHTHGKAPERRRVCGVTPLNFWIMIFALIIILAAGLGGGLGAGLSRTNSSDRNGNPDNNSAALL